jgi:hypothetical protein
LSCARTLPLAAAPVKSSRTGSWSSAGHRRSAACLGTRRRDCSIAACPRRRRAILSQIGGTINARDALPDGDAIDIALDRLTVDAAIAPGEPAVSAGEYIRLRVRDNGVGMTPDVQAHLFEPFFTTKEVGEGAGLGQALRARVAVRRSPSA